MEIAVVLFQGAPDCIGTNNNENSENVAFRYIYIVYCCLRTRLARPLRYTADE